MPSWPWTPSNLGWSATPAIRTVESMLTTGEIARDDLFTHIHKALRLALFDVTVAAGRTDWDDAREVAELERQWRPLLGLLRAHTAHEETYIFRLLDACDPIAVEPDHDQHQDLEDLLDDLDGRFDAIVQAPGPADGLAFYRDLARFVAAYLPHLHDEETRVMSRIWECCTDEEIAATRAAFMADTSPEVHATTLRYLLPAIDRHTRRTLARGLAGAPEEMVSGVLAIAEQVLTDADEADLRAQLVTATDPRTR